MAALLKQVEIPIARDGPLTREWTVVCDAAGYAVCLAGWEPPLNAPGRSAERYFEVIWSVEQLRLASAITNRTLSYLSVSHAEQAGRPLR